MKHSKCTWYYISWTFNNDGTPTMCNNTSYIINLLDSATYKYHLIHQLPIYSPFKYLGSESFPSGNTKYQFNTINKHAKRGACITHSSKIIRYHINLYLKTHLHPKLIFPLAYIFLTNKQYNSIQKKYISTALSSTGYNHTWSIALSYGNKKYCGL